MTTLALFGDKDLAYLTHRELEAAVGQLPAGVEARWTATDSAAAADLGWADGIWVLPGTPYRDTGAVLRAIGRAVEDGTPLLGTCGGFQHVVLVLAERLAGVVAPAHAELAPEASDPVVAPLACSLVGEEREVTCVPGTRLAAICGAAPFTGFHYCNYGLAPGFEAALEAGGAVISARAPDAGAEGIELPAHPFFVATLFQPQVGALAGRPLHPLIGAFCAAAAAAAPAPATRG